MFLGIDHLVIAVADPDEAATQLERALGLAATGGGRHDAIGTFNRLVWLGDSYIELIGVFDRALAEHSWIGEPALEALDVGGGFVTWAIATNDLEADVARLRQTGSELGEPIAGERRRADAAIVRWRLSKPRRLGSADPPFLLEHDPASAEWTPADRVARSAQRHPIGAAVRLEVLELPVSDLNGTIQRFVRTIGLQFRPSLSGGGSRDATIGVQTVRLRRKSGGSASTVVHLAAPVPERRTSDLFGCRWIVRSTS
jgi:Glyoxalase-like domain